MIWSLIDIDWEFDNPTFYNRERNKCSARLKYRRIVENQNLWKPNVFWKCLKVERAENEILEVFPVDKLTKKENVKKFSAFFRHSNHKTIASFVLNFLVKISIVFWSDRFPESWIEASNSRTNKTKTYRNEFLRLRLTFNSFETNLL